MPRLKKTVRPVRLNLAMSPQVRKRLESLQERIDADSLAEVIRRALAVYDLLLATHEEGNSVQIVDFDGKATDVKLFI